MSRLRWLNPVLWLYLLYGMVAAIRVIRKTGACEACEIGDRGEVPEWDDLCDIHQEHLLAISPHIEDGWRRLWE